MRYSRCSVCGVPRMIGRLNRWLPNGVISSKADPRIRQVFIEADLLPDTRALISQGLGFPVNRIFYEAERNSTRIVVEALLRSRLKRMALGIPPFRRGAVHFFHSLAAMTGTAHSATVEYRQGKYGVARMRNPWDLDLMAAVVVGAFEALEGKPLRSFWKELDGEYILRVEVTDRKPELSERLRRNKLAALEAGRPEAVLTSNVGCQTHLAAGATVPVRHWIVDLDARLAGRKIS